MTNLFSEKALMEKAEKWSRTNFEKIWVDGKWEVHQQACICGKPAYIAGAKETLSSLRELLENKIDKYEQEMEVVRVSYKKACVGGREENLYSRTLLSGINRQNELKELLAELKGKGGKK